MRALLLDLDDTLLDYSGGVDQCWEHACGTVTLDGLPPAALVRAVAEARQWFWSDPERHRRERVDMLGAWRQIVARALERCEARAPDGLAAAVAEAFAARRRAVMRLFPDAAACLQRLREGGVPLALVTNGDAGQQRDKIERHALARYFGAIVIEGEFGRGKPDAEVYRAALAQLAVAPGPDVWMVGDHLEFDVAGPQRLGLRALWLDRAGAGLPPGSTVRPDGIIRELCELTALALGAP